MSLFDVKRVEGEKKLKLLKKNVCVKNNTHEIYNNRDIKVGKAVPNSGFTVPEIVR